MIQGPVGCGKSFLTLIYALQYVSTNSSHIIGIVLLIMPGSLQYDQRLKAN